MQMTSAGKQLLLRAGAELGLNLEPHIPQFSTFFDLLTEANQTTNLTAIRDEEGIILKHFVDSLTCLTYPGLVEGISVIDVGTGAGFPGLPLAIVQPSTQFDLLDATQKKTAFVARVIQTLGLKNARALWGRSEELAHQNVKRETYGAALTRAVASMATVAELTLPLVQVGGFVLVQKGAEVEHEVAEARGALSKLGGQLEQIFHLQLPIIGDARTLVVLRKIAPTPHQYPRKPGVPAKNPLS
ncbi:16S rRNA (guanine(527)-N(7))-methyltransferase RsmG [Meiothermus cerbereus]|uniref:16S rRNA (guanine(527)-N(7))-methyltransferase RsmG n=1 Tax=Meiothermus cerbereus TaxID=65552 RepID=UPI003EEF79FB